MKGNLRKKIKRFYRVYLKRNKKSRAFGYRYSVENLKGKNGIEIGGPSKFFSRQGAMPVYPLLGSLDNCNYSNKTIWMGTLGNKGDYFFDSKKNPGRQYVAEASDLREIEKGKYDFILSSHVIEHVANPILALKEWSRVINESGFLLMIVPDKDKTFDHKRPVTQMEHLIEDYNNEILEDDKTHLDEIIKLHDLELDTGSESYEQFHKRITENYKYRCMHHHVFDLPLVVSLVEYSGFQVVMAERVSPCHIVVVGRKLLEKPSADKNLV